MSDELVKPLRDWQNSVHNAGPFQVPEYEDFARMVEAMEGMAERIEALEAANRGLVRLNEVTERRADPAEAALDAWKRIAGGMENMAETYSAALAAEQEKVARLERALLEVEHIYYMEATNPDPGYIRKMAARMRAAAQDALASVQTGEKP